MLSTKQKKKKKDMVNKFFIYRYSEGLCSFSSGKGFHNPQLNDVFRTCIHYWKTTKVFLVTGQYWNLRIQIIYKYEHNRIQ